MNLTNNEQNHFAKYIQEFKSETRPQDSNMKKVKEHVLALAMALLKEKKKWYLKHLKVEYLEFNQAAMINIH